jgi:hypothetical protein
MELPALVGLGFLLLVFVVMIPRMRDRYEEVYEDERSFFREQRPRMWGLVGGMTGGVEGVDEPSEAVPGWCPVCGADNVPDFTYCGNCGRRLPVDEE